QPFRRWVDRQDDSRVRTIAVPALGEHNEFARHDLLAVVIAHRPRDEQQLPLLDLPLEKRPARPGALEQPAVVSEDRPKYAQPAARRQHTGVDHTADARDVLSD